MSRYNETHVDWFDTEDLENVTVESQNFAEQGKHNYKINIHSHMESPWE